MKQPLSTPNAMEKRSTFAVTTVGKSFSPRPLVLRSRKSLDHAVDNSGFVGLIANGQSTFFPCRSMRTPLQQIDMRQ
jgi:hypothetical protein